MKIQITTIFIFVIVVASLMFFCLWRYTANSLKNTRIELETAQSTIQTLNKDKEKLIEDITQKDKAIKDLEKEYTEVLDNIPSDQCGDVKPSKELLNYFRKTYNK